MRPRREGRGLGQVFKHYQGSQAVRQSAFLVLPQLSYPLWAPASLLQSPKLLKGLQQRVL